MAEIPILRMDAQNWSAWRKNLERTLNKLAISAYISETTPDPYDKQANALAKCAITSTIPDSLFLRILHFKSAQECFETLRDLFEKKSTATTVVLQEIQSARTKQEAMYGLETANNRIQTCTDADGITTYHAASHVVSTKEKQKTREESKEGVEKLPMRLGKGATDHRASGVSLVKPTSSQLDTPDGQQRGHWHLKPERNERRDDNASGHVERTAERVQQSQGRQGNGEKDERASGITDPSLHDDGGDENVHHIPPPPSTPLEGEEENGHKTKATMHLIWMPYDKELSGERPTPSLRLERERNRPLRSTVDTKVEDNHDTQQSPRRPVGMTDSDERHPNEPTEPPDKKEGERGANNELRDKTTIKNVETDKSSQRDKAGKLTRQQSP
ncbi:hypothetical protein PAXINDRAFT_15779 [Paxillus involutus ATCC 200175]|uniref:Uncharacterized protein n=1 Tax=Paxillus involutus ATCC 200175 TaxID=664439 RepID=A0A0C9TVH0_PAXIN|nr:hypothetical protein PAXINDRAFT_15779 [Paxillus involutus ATCC 200175]